MFSAGWSLSGELFVFVSNSRSRPRRRTVILIDNPLRAVSADFHPARGSAIRRRHRGNGARLYVITVHSVRDLHLLALSPATLPSDGFFGLHVGARDPWWMGRNMVVRVL